jgi:Zn-dependent M28 family amino/carboxypeptidase
VTAHLDHLGVVVDGDGRRRVAPGAVDNASGVAAILELGRRLTASPALSRAIILAATDAEEAGLVGSTVLVEQLARAGVRVVANINIDGATLMQHPLVDLVALGGRDSDLGALAEAAARRVGVEMSFEHTPIAGSDHFPFALAGIPAVWLVAGTKTSTAGLDNAELQARWMREVYHTPRDSMAQPLNFVAAARLVDVLEAVVRRLLVTEQPSPKWNDNVFWSTRRR